MFVHCDILNGMFTLPVEVIYIMNDCIKYLLKLAGLLSNCSVAWHATEASLLCIGLTELQDAVAGCLLLS